MLEEYKKDYDSITVPSNLKVKTLLKMKEEERHHVFRWKPIALTLSTIGAAAAIMFFFLPSNEIQSDLRVGTTTEKVTLKNGEMIFEQDADIHARFAKGEKTSVRTINKEEAKYISKQDIKPFEIKDASLTKKGYNAYYKGDTLSYVEWLFTYAIDKGEIHISIINPAKKLSENSKLGNKEMAVYYDSAKDAVYDAYYNEGKNTIHVNASNIEQERFVTLMLELAKK